MRVGSTRSSRAAQQPLQGVDVPLSPRSIGRTLGVLYLSGATLAWLWTLLPHPAPEGDLGVRAMIVVALLMGGGLSLGVADRAPLWAFHLVIGAIQVVIAVAYLGAQVPDNDIRLFFLWATPFAAYFFTPRAALLHGLWTALCLVGALGQTEASAGVGLRVLLTTLGTLAAVGLLVGFAAGSSRRSRRLLQHTAWHDGLSGLPNRVLFEQRVGSALAERDRRGGSVHLLLVDLDHFKLVNDTYGHHAGDELISVVAPRLQEAVGAGATVARMGGDEFAVVLSDPVEDRLDGLLERLSRVWSEPVRLDGGLVPVSASAGLATCSGPGGSAETLLRDADVALYRAKQTHRGSVRRFDRTLRVEVERRTRLDHELRGAAARGELTVVYQPVVAMATGRTVAAEALLRWHHPELGPVPPSEFVPVAEDNGLVVPIGRFVLEEVARDVGAWRSAGTVGDDFTVAVNVSVRQLGEEFPDTFARLLLRHGLPASALTVEVTESVLLDGTLWSGTVLSRLRSAGTRVALDDFGTGYSSLSYLQRLPMDTLKIDRSFVSELDGDRPRIGLVQAVVDLARSLGMDVVAEGVETTEQAQRLLGLGVERAQGWLFARPLGADDFVDRLRVGVGRA